MTITERNRQLVLEFWQAVYEDRDPERIGSFFHSDGIYVDAAMPDTAGVGPRGVSARLEIGHGRIESFDHQIHHLVADGDTVVTEHTATWHFPTGEVIPLPFASVHVIRDGKFELWRDHWDITAWVAAAPSWWIDHVTRDTLPGARES